jgi:hypothetical protein
VASEFSVAPRDNLLQTNLQTYQKSMGDPEFALDDLLEAFSTDAHEHRLPEADSCTMMSFDAVAPLQFTAAPPQITAAPPRATAHAVLPTQRCWGQELTYGGTTCTVGFSPGVGHFKGKFCPTCIATGLSLDPSRALLLPDGGASFANKPGPSFYSEEGGIIYRLINQTHRCEGAAILLLRSSADAPALGLARVPDSLLVLGRLHLSLAKGTLVPTASLAKARHVWTHATSAAVSATERDGRSSPTSSSGDRDGSSSDQNDSSVSASSSFNKRSRIEMGDDASSSRACPSPSGEQSGNELLDLATLHAQVGSSLQASLALAASSTDPNVQAYRAALLGVLSPLEQAAEALQRAIHSRPDAAA